MLNKILQMNIIFSLFLGSMSALAIEPEEVLEKSGLVFNLVEDEILIVDQEDGFENCEENDEDCEKRNEERRARIYGNTNSGANGANSVSGGGSPNNVAGTTAGAAGSAASGAWNTLLKVASNPIVQYAGAAIIAAVGAKALGASLTQSVLAAVGVAGAGFLGAPLLPAIAVATMLTMQIGNDASMLSTGLQWVRNSLPLHRIPVVGGLLASQAPSVDLSAMPTAPTRSLFGALRNVAGAVRARVPVIIRN